MKFLLPQRMCMMPHRKKVIGIFDLFFLIIVAILFVLFCLFFVVLYFIAFNIYFLKHFELPRVSLCCTHKLPFAFFSFGKVGQFVLDQHGPV